MSGTQPWLWPGFALAVLASAGFLVFLLRQNRGQRRNLGTMLSLVVWACLVFLGWYHLRPQPPVLEKAILVTEGAELNSVRELLDQMPKGIRVLSLPSAPELTKMNHPITPVPDTAWLHRNMPPETSWHLAGWGLSASELAGLNARSVAFHPTTTPLGFESIQWPRTLELGQTWVFRGRLNRSCPQGWRIGLQAPSGEMVGEQQLDEGVTTIVLEDQPALAGTLQYRLILQDADGNTQLQEILPVQVTEPKRLEVWCLLGGPRFEIKFLKQLLGESGSSMMIRTRMTDTDWRKEVINRDPLGQSLDALPWEEADALLLDFPALAALSEQARKSLMQAVENGLGVFLFPEALAASKKDLDPTALDFFADWQMQWQEEGIEQLQASLHWRGEFALPREKVEILPGMLQLKKGQQVLADDGFGGVLAASTRRGEGMLATSLVRHSQRWVMLGAKADFRSYWSHILSRISRPVTPPPRLGFATPAQVDRPLVMNIWAEEPARFTLKGQRVETNLPWASDSLAWGRRTGQFRPSETGWQSAAWDGKSFDAFYVFPRQAWQTLRATRHVAATTAFVETHQAKSFPIVSKAVAWMAILVALLLLTATALWIGEKFQRI